MNTYCPNCGRIIPADATRCDYCGKLISFGRTPVTTIRSTEKSKSTNITLIVTIIAALIIITTFVVAATVYVYVSEMIEPSEISNHELASVRVLASDERYIEIILTGYGDKYGTGYTDVKIYIENLEVNNLSTIYPWTVGEKISIGNSTTGFSVDGNALDPGKYDISVTILNTLVFMHFIEIK